MTKTATFIRKIEGWTGDVRLYRLSEPVEYSDDLKGKTIKTTNYVIVSATTGPPDMPSSGPETYIFPADENGETLDMGALSGSFRGGLDHWKALKNAGYLVVELGFIRGPRDDDDDGPLGLVHVE